MKDIASELGVSIALVSYVLNGKNQKRINADTAKKILDLAREKNYFPNQIAKSLKNNKTHTLGLIVADISNFFYSYIARYIEDEANRYRNNVLFGSAYEDPERFKSLLNVMMSRQVDGLILAIPDGAEDVIPYLQNLNIPFVVIDRVFPKFQHVNSICLDNFKASEMVVEDFLKRGYKRLGAIGLSTNLFHLHERKRGFTETAQRHIGKENVFVYEVDESDMNNRIESLIHKAIYDDKIDALCCFTNKIAMSTLPIILKYGIEVPKKLGIICYDEAEAYRLFPYPLSYVKQPLKDMSQSAVQFLVDTGRKPQDGIYEFQGELIDVNV